MDIRIILPPLIGAAIGWFTNFVAIKLLFRPQNPVSLLGFKVQGLIPKRRAEIAKGIAHTIEKDLFSSSDISSVFENIDWKDEVEKTVDEAIEDRLGSEKLKGVPIIGLFSGNVKHHIKQLITKEILRQFDRKKDDLRSRLHGSVDVKQVVETKIDALDLTRFEGMLQGFISKELKHLEWLGGLMGFFIGLFQSAFFYFFY